MKAVVKGARVVHPRRSDVIGTVLDDSDPFSKLVRIAWDGGGESMVFVGVLVPARERRRAAA